MSLTSLQPKAVITDLDNTLFDWVKVWHRGFDAQLRTLIQRTGADRTELIRRFQELHRRYGTSEYAFAAREVLLDGLARDNASARVEAERAQRRARRATLRVYPGVRPTLRALRQMGIRVVGFTDSMGLYTLARLRDLRLDGLLESVYTPETHHMPEGERQPDLRNTVHRILPTDRRKPDPGLLEMIVSDLNVRKEECLYVGDSLMKDVAMAQRAGVLDVWAEYGTAQHRPEYELLRQVSHWTELDIEREKQFTAPRPPAFTLSHSFSELLGLIAHRSHSRAAG